MPVLSSSPALCLLASRFIQSFVSFPADMNFLRNATALLGIGRVKGLLSWVTDPNLVDYKTKTTPLDIAFFTLTIVWVQRGGRGDLFFEVSQVQRAGVGFFSNPSRWKERMELQKVH